MHVRVKFITLRWCNFLEQIALESRIELLERDLDAILPRLQGLIGLGQRCFETILDGNQAFGERLCAELAGLGDLFLCTTSIVFLFVIGS